MSGKGKGKWIYRIRNDSAERFAFSFMYSNTQFRTKKNGLYNVFWIEKVDLSSLGYTEAFKIVHAYVYVLVGGVSSSDWKRRTRH